MAEWRYLAQRIGGDAHGEIFETELPVTGFTRGRALSAPPAGSATLSHRIARLIAPDGQPLIKKWQTAIYAVADDQIRAGYLVRNAPWNGEDVQLSLVGFSGYPIGMPYEGVKEYVDEDPMNIFRHIWEHVQTQSGSYLGVQVSDLTSPMRVGKPPRQVEFTTGDGEDVQFLANDESFKLNWWSTFNLGGKIDELTQLGSFDWVERHEWGDGAEPIDHFIDLGYPQIGGQRTDSRLVYGENIITEPDVIDGDTEDYATDIIVLGAGEGRDRIRGFAGRPREGIRRTKVIEDKNIDTVGQANRVAQESLAHYRGLPRVSTVTVKQHDNADIHALQPGDEVPYYAETTHGTLDTWVRILRAADRPEVEEVVELTVMPV